jgi:DNA mismatch endonuclease (patch repair protein)
MLRVRPHSRKPAASRSGTDIFSSRKRSRIMSLIRGKNTKPEILVRQILGSLGYSFKNHVASLPGTPDIVLSNPRLAIFVNGCFWHGHSSCSKGTTLPKTRRQFWQNKIRQNVKRDRAAIRKLRREGWRVLRVWECKLKNRNKMAVHLKCFIDKKGQG